MMPKQGYYTIDQASSNYIKIDQSTVNYDEIFRKMKENAEHNQKMDPKLREALRKIGAK